MTTTQIAYFLELADCLSFTRAAENLYISQPALSRQIISLETELNTQLFLRRGNRIQLTPPGEVFRKGAQVLFQDYKQLVKAVEDASKGSQNLCIGVLEEQMMDAGVLHALTWFYTYRQEISVSVIKDTFSGLLSRLEDQSIDLAVTMTFMVDGKRNLEYKAVRRNTLYLAMSKNFSISSLERVTIEELSQVLKDIPFLLVSPNDAAPGNQQQLSDLAAGGFRPERIIYAPSESMMSLRVASGMGAAIMSDNHVLFHDPSMSFIPIDGMPQTETALVWRRGEINPLVEQFVDCVSLYQKLERLDG